MERDLQEVYHDITEVYILLKRAQEEPYATVAETMIQEAVTLLSASLNVLEIIANTKGTES